MSALPVIAIFDIGKTNKKILLFDEQYKIVFEESVQLPETNDEDGFPCEDVSALTNWIKDSLFKAISLSYVTINAINFSTYGASFVHVNDKGIPVAPLYNYLKPFSEKLKQDFYKKYGGEITFSQTTASPVLGSLNSGLQLYRLKYEQPALFEKIHYSLHLPQYISSTITGKYFSDITSIGCHTGLWNFPQKHYHEWLYREGIIDKLADIFPSDQVVQTNWNSISLQAGIGLHDSSAALIPYLSNFKNPFVLLSTGTWCISLNPFNQTSLTQEELSNDCLCYMEYHGKPIKASRLFAGYEHEQQTKRLAEHFNVPGDCFSSIEFDASVFLKLSADNNSKGTVSKTVMVQESAFSQRKLSDFDNYVIAYHQLMMDIVEQQEYSTNLVLKNTDVKKIFVDGGFSKNSVYMNLLTIAFPHMEVYAATVAQASAMGAAMAIQRYWNKHAMPAELIELKYYKLSHDAISYQ